MDDPSQSTRLAKPLALNPFPHKSATLAADRRGVASCSPAFAASSVGGTSAQARLLLACGGPHTFPPRSRNVPLIAVAVHARDVEEASRHADGVSFVHGRGASI